MKMNLLLILCCSFLIGACNGNDLAPADLVNPLQGTNSERNFSTGNTYPAVARPWGNNFWTPQTRRNGDGWQYVYTDLSITGFKQTHQPSPWINDYGCWSIMPQKGNPQPDWKKRALSYRRENEKSSPYCYEVLFDNGISTSMTATINGAAFHITYGNPLPETEGTVSAGIGNGSDGLSSEETGNSSIVLDLFSGKGSLSIDQETNRIYGKSSFYAKNNNSRLPDNFATYFMIETKEDICSFRIYENGKEIRNCDNLEGRNITAVISFGDAEEVNLTTASSFISADQAYDNFRRELGNKDFQKLKAEAKEEWNRSLSVIEVESRDKEQLRTFYTAMYRAMLFPRKTHELDVNGNKIHYSFFTGETKEGPMYADNGFWDTFRAVHPLFNLIRPSLSAEFMEALLNIYDEGGWLPEWFSPAYKDCMIGQHSASVVTDAYLKGIGDFDKEKMFEALLKGAENEGPKATGRIGIEAYRDYGYVPSDIGLNETVSNTLEYAYDDFCIYLFAKKLGAPQEILEKYRNRASFYKNVFDKETGFVRPRCKDGSWAEGFSPDDWSKDFTEGSSWHWTWSVFQDPAGLIDLMGGEGQFAHMLDSVFTAAPTVGLGGRKKMIHEMEEMVAGNMGQYAHGNQPIQHMAYLYNYAGKPYMAQKHVHEIATRMYHSGIEDGKGLCGDEDNGQTSSWYIFSSLGFYPVCPVSGEYIIGTPLFSKATMHLENGRDFSVTTENLNGEEPSADEFYIQSATLNGKAFNKSFITYDEIMAGGNLHFIMGAEPSLDWAATSRPYSLSKSH